MKKTLSLILALLMLIAVFTACGETNVTEETTEAEVITQAVEEEETTDSKYDSNGYLKDSLPELNFNDQEIGFLYDTDVDQVDFFATETNGEAINDAIFARNNAVEERLHVKLVYSGELGSDGNQTAFLKKAQADLQADCEFTMYGAYSRTIPLLAYNGLCTNLLKTDYIDIDNPWWPSALTDECTIHDTLYFCTGEISTNTLWMMMGLFYNQQIMEDQHLDRTPEDIVLSGDWTLDLFCEVCSNAYSEGADESSTIYGMTAYNACLDAFLNSCGVISIEKNDEGDLELSDDFTGEKTIGIVEKLGVLYTSSSAVHHSSSSNERKMFYNSQSLFCLDGTFITAPNTAGSISFEYGLMPVPKYDEEQETYITNLRYPYNMYAISSNATDEMKNIASATIEALASDSYRRVTPVQFETTMKVRYSKDNNTAKIYDILRENIVFDVGRIHNYSINNFYPNFRNYCINGGKNWASFISGMKKSMNKMLKTLTEVYDDE